MAERESVDWRRVYWATWSFIGWVLLGLATLWLVGRLWTVVLPLVIATIIVFFLRPPVEWLASRGIPRLAAVVIAYAVAGALLTAAAAVVVPIVTAQAQQFAESLPQYFDQLTRFGLALRERYESLELPGWLVLIGEQALAGVLGEGQRLSRTTTEGLFAAGTRSLAIVTGLITGLVIGFFLLRSLPRVGPGILSTMPRGWRRNAWEAANRIEEVVGAFIRGQAIVAFFVGLLTWLGMALIGMPFAVLLGIIAGLANIVPFVGPIVAGAIGAVIGLFVDPWLALGAVAVVTVVQQIESAYLTPRVMSGQLGLHPVIVILVIIAGTTLFGLPGLIFAVPVAGVVRTLLEMYAEQHGWHLGEGVPEQE